MLKPRSNSSKFDFFYHGSEARVELLLVVITRGSEKNVILTPNALFWRRMRDFDAKKRKL